MNHHIGQQDVSSGELTSNLRAKIQTELAFFEGAAERARSWRKAWEASPPADRENLIPEQAELLQEVLERDEFLRQIYQIWQSYETSFREEDRSRVQEEVERLDQVMRSLLQIEKQNLQIADQMRRELIREISDLRAARQAHAAYQVPDGSPPRCVDRDL